MTKSAPIDDHTVRIHPQAQTNYISSFVHALHGVLHVIKHERNARIHLGFAVVAFGLGELLGVTNAELAAVFLQWSLCFWRKCLIRQSSAHSI